MYYLRYPSGFVTVSVDLDVLFQKVSIPVGFESEGVVFLVESLSSAKKSKISQNIVSDSAILNFRFVYPNQNPNLGGTPVSSFSRDSLINFTSGALSPLPDSDPNYVKWYAVFVEAKRTSDPLQLKIVFDTSHDDFASNDLIYRFHIKKLSLQDNQLYLSEAIAEHGYDIVLGGGIFSARDGGHQSVANIYKSSVGLDFGNNSSSVCIIKDSDPSPDTLENELIIHEDSVMSICKGEILHTSDTFLPGTKEIRSFCHSSYMSEHSGRHVLRCNIGKRVPFVDGLKAETDPFAHRSMKRSLAHPRSFDDLNAKQPIDLAFAERYFDKFGSYVCPVTSKERQFRVPLRVPSELYLTEMLDKIASRTMSSRLGDYSQGRVGTPSNIVLTYPITYGIKEIIQYKACFARAFLRHFNIQQPNPGSSTGMAPRLPAVFNQAPAFQTLIDDCYKVIKDPKTNFRDLPNFPVKAMIDEASAAAYYYIRKFLVSRKTFYLEGFQFHYPEGCRIVVIDCGAGTTDVAAFDIDPVFANTPQGKKIVKVKVELKKRTGDHHFCGDVVTKQIILFVLAKIIYANESADNSNRFADASSFIKLDKNQGFNVIKPWLFISKVFQYFYKASANSATRRELAFIDVEKLQSNDARKGLMAQKSLVDLAENLKKEFGKAEQIEKKNIFKSVLDGMRGIESIISDFYANSSETDKRNANLENVKSRLEKLFITYDEIKLLVENRDNPDPQDPYRVQGSLHDFTNMVKTSIIFPVIEKPNGSDQIPNEKFVSRVIVTGKGSLFRPVIESLRDNLGLLDPDTQLVNLASLLQDTEQLKRCVSIGASWWLSDKTSPNALIDMDCEQLEKVLPYDLIIQLGNGFVVKAHVGSFYSDLPNILAEPIFTDNPIKQIKLYKRFPGGQPSAFNAFEFSNHVNQFRIQWDNDLLEFVVENAQKDTSFQGDLENYGKSPLWSVKG